MAERDGALPEGGIGPLVCELLVEHIGPSCDFWTTMLGFEIAYRRPEQGFVFLHHPEGGQIMLCERSGIWETAEMERPFGRGVMFQLVVGELDVVEKRLATVGWPLDMKRREVWRKLGDREGGRLEIAVLDPDGYLVMIAEPIGERPIGSA